MKPFLKTRAKTTGKMIPKCPLEASPVVFGREDGLPAANGISARQPVPATMSLI
jgi:hypothetical protein